VRAAIMKIAVSFITKIILESLDHARGTALELKFISLLSLG
jgi:hypothetical protein